MKPVSQMNEQEYINHLHKGTFGRIWPAVLLTFAILCGIMAAFVWLVGSVF